jgi:hypothetical protein
VSIGLADALEKKTMFTKATITLSALLLFGATATAVAYDDPEAKIGDRYPQLETGPSHGSKAIAKRMTVSRLGSSEIEDPESKMGDRYPLQDKTYASVSTAVAVNGMRPTTVQVWAGEVEDPEEKIADRYPLLEPRVQTVRVTTTPVVRAMRPTPSIKVSGMKVRNSGSAN